LEARRPFVSSGVRSTYRDFISFPGVDLLEAYRFVDRQNGLG
tara:strand:+ start:296 stop:421 length:126 start_codon:yes stop_codon:yes gene_type:complete